MSVEDIVIEECEGVYSPAEDSYLLLRSMECGRKVLEIGCGTGILSISCAIRGSDVHSADISESALECTLRNAENNDVTIRAFHSDIFSGIPSGEMYDTIVFNPPYLPSSDNLPEAEQWNGGIDGFALTRPFLREAPGHLLPGGEIYLVLSSLTSIESLIREFPGLKFSIAGEESYFFEKVLVFRITSSEATE